MALSGVAVPQESHHASNVLAIKAQLQSQLQVEPELINAQVHVSARIVCYSERMHNLYEHVLAI